MYKKYYWLFLLLAAIYLVSTFAAPINPAMLARYNITELQLRFATITVVIPILFIWLAAFYGFIHFETYAARIKQSPDGRGLKLVADGLLWLGVGFMLNSVVSSLLTYLVRQHITVQATATIITTHVALVFPLVAFALILLGTQRLLTMIDKPRLPWRYDIVLALAVALIGIVFTLLTFNNPSRTSPVPPAIVATYYLSDWLIFATIILPYVCIWVFGLFAVARLHVYQMTVRGSIYRQALRTLEYGIVAVILTSIGLQFLGTATTALGGLGFNALLILVYVLLAAIGAGYILIALGARKLKVIEDIV